MVQPNYQFRALTTNAAEARTVRDAFARSVLWGFPIAAVTGDRVLVDFTEYLVRDGNDMARRLRPGSYRFDATRSSIYPPMTLGFPKNTEMEAELTFVRNAGAAGGRTGRPGGGRGGGGGGGVFRGRRQRRGDRPKRPASASTTPSSSCPTRTTSRVASIRASGFGSMDYENYAALPGQPMTERFIRRHRLQKKDPAAAVSEPVKPIVYYLDPGAPEPIRSALLDGARWWNQAFEAAGYRDAFRVELLPEGVSPLDIRYNVINWVHRSTRGWSTGGSVSDPRTGEIIKGVVTLGSLRIRQDYMIAEGLLSPYKDGTETPQGADRVGARPHPPAVGARSRPHARDRPQLLRQHGRPHLGDGLSASARDDEGATATLDYSKVYDVGIGAWDKVAITYGYSDFPAGTDEAKALATILEDGHKKDLWYLSNQDIDAHPRVDTWSNGTDATAELKRMMAIRKFALSRFGEQAIKRNAPMATIEEVLVPLYLHHRYQVEAAASTVGGIYFTYAMRGDGREPVKFAPAAEQKRRARRAARDAETVGAGAAARAPRQDSAAAVRLRQHARALPALHRPDVRRDHARRRRLRPDRRLSPRRRAGGAAGRAARARPGAAGPRDRHRPAAVVDIWRHEREPVRGRDRARRPARRRRTPDDARRRPPTCRRCGRSRRRSCSSARNGLTALHSRPTPAPRRTRRSSRRTSSGSSIGRSRPRLAPTSRPRLPARRSAIREWTGWERLAPYCGWE